MRARVSYFDWFYYCEKEREKRKDNAILPCRSLYSDKSPMARIFFFFVFQTRTFSILDTKNVVGQTQSTHTHRFLERHGTFLLQKSKEKLCPPSLQCVSVFVVIFFKEDSFFFLSSIFLSSACDVFNSPRERLSSPLPPCKSEKLSLVCDLKL